VIHGLDVPACGTVSDKKIRRKTEKIESEKPGLPGTPGQVPQTPSRSARMPAGTLTEKRRRDNELH
jgi:hypothetical protein